MESHFLLACHACNLIIFYFKDIHLWNSESFRPLSGPSGLWGPCPANAGFCVPGPKKRNSHNLPCMPRHAWQINFKVPEYVVFSRNPGSSFIHVNTVRIVWTLPRGMSLIMVNSVKAVNNLQDKRSSLALSGNILQSVCSQGYNMWC